MLASSSQGIEDIGRQVIGLAGCRSTGALSNIAPIIVAYAILLRERIEKRHHVRAATAVTRFKKHCKRTRATAMKGDAPVTIQRDHLVDLLYDRCRTSVTVPGEQPSGEETKREAEVTHFHVV